MANMPRTFSLATLLLAITIVCLLCGVAVNCPFLLEPFFALFFGIPVMAITCVLSCFSKQRGLLIFNALVGAIFALALLPTFGPLLRPAPLTFDSPDLSFTVPAIGAMAFGGSFLLMEIHDRSRQSH